MVLSTLPTFEEELGARLRRAHNDRSAVYSTAESSISMVNSDPVLGHGQKPRMDGQRPLVTPVQEYPKIYPLPGLRRLTFICSLERRPTLYRSTPSPTAT